jgi:hypothetical protein
VTVVLFHRPAYNENACELNLLGVRSGFDQVHFSNLAETRGDSGVATARKSLTGIGFCFVFVFVASGAMAQDIKTNAMPGTDFSKYHRYKRVIIEGGVHPNQIMDQETKQSVDSQLATKTMAKLQKNYPPK